MMNPVTTFTDFTDFLLEEERNFPNATGSLALLLVQLENAVKIISSHVRESGLSDILGATGSINKFADEVQKLDFFCNDLLIKTLGNSGQVHAMISEEEEKPVYSERQGEYIVYFDPLDGSTNIDVNAPIGTIFSIYHKSGGLLQPGKKQVASGYAIYGSSTMLVFTTGRSVNGFTLDPSIGSFLLSHPDMRIPEDGKIYSINEAYSNKYNDKLLEYLSYMKNKPKISSRYIGSSIADIHRTLIKGGIFLYPTDSSRPEGKLRLMLEVNPLSFVVQTAGGKAWSNNRNPLDIVPEDIHQRAPIVMGSKLMVEEYIAKTK